MRKSLKRILSAVMALVMLFGGAQFACAANAGFNKENEIINDFRHMNIEGTFFIDYGKKTTIRPKLLDGAVSYIVFPYFGGNAIENVSETVLYGNDYGAALLSISEYDRDGNYVGSVNYLGVVVDENDKKTDGYMKDSYDIEIDLKYKDKVKIEPEVYTVGEVKTYIIISGMTVGKSAEIRDENYIYGKSRGTDTYRAIVVDTHGNYEFADVTVHVKYTFVQWLIKIFLLGFLWY